MLEQNPKFDEHAPLLSLPLIMKTTLKNVPARIPYLFARPDLVAQWKDKLAEILTLELVFAGKEMINTALHFYVLQ